MIIRYNPKLKQLARNLRNRSTLAEVLFWNQVKRKQFRGYQFLRQKPIGEFIVDFYCPPLKLIVEIDGDTHFGNERNDAKRQSYLESLGLTVARFTDEEVKKDITTVFTRLDALVNRVESEL